MGERRIETLEEQLFPPIFPRSEGIEPTVSLYPQKRNGRTMYIVAKEVIISE